MRRRITRMMMMTRSIMRTRSSRSCWIRMMKMRLRTPIMMIRPMSRKSKRALMMGLKKNMMRMLRWKMAKTMRNRCWI